MKLCADLAFFGQGVEPALRFREFSLEPLTAGQGEQDQLLWPRLIFLLEVWMSKGKWVPPAKSSVYLCRSSLLRQRFF